MKPVGRPQDVDSQPIEEVGIEDSLAEEADADENMLPDIVDVSSETEVAGTAKKIFHVARWT